MSRCSNGIFIKKPRYGETDSLRVLVSLAISVAVTLVGHAWAGGPSELGGNYPGIATGRENEKYTVTIDSDGTKRLCSIDLDGTKLTTIIRPNGKKFTLLEAPNGEKSIIRGMSREVYANIEAAELVEQARSFDPMYCAQDRRNRDKAIMFYEKAIAAQPGASINAAIANRIAQLYAFYEDKASNVHPIATKAAHWWNRSIEGTSPKQLLWAQAQMGIASASIMGRDWTSAILVPFP